MSEESLRIIDKRATLHHQPDHNRNMACTFTRDLWRLITTDSWRQAEAATEEIGACLNMTQGTSPDLQGAYTIL